MRENKKCANYDNLYNLIYKFYLMIYPMKFFFFIYSIDFDISRSRTFVLIMSQNKF